MSELRFPNFAEGAWIRTCNECGHNQTATKPSTNKELTDSYRNSKCRKCKSEGLDYGQVNSIEEDWYE